MDQPETDGLIRSESNQSIGKVNGGSNIIPSGVPPSVAARVMISSGFRPPLERTASVPERSSISKKTLDKWDSVDRGSKDSLYDRYRARSVDKQTERTINGCSIRKRSPLNSVSDRTASLSSLKELFPVDENNIPQIDEAITPTDSDVEADDPLLPAYDDMFTNLPNSVNNNRGEHHKAVNKPPNLKLLRSSDSRRSSTRSRGSQGSNGSRYGNPHITITVNEDQQSVVSDYLSPDKNYIHSPTVQFIGDDVSLYGTPKEELSPTKDTAENNTIFSSSASFLKDQIISFFQPSDNKLAMKLFGNKNALIKEKMRQKEAGNWVIHPCSNFR